LGGNRAPDALKGPVEPNGSASSKESNRPKFLELFDESNPAAFSPAELLIESNLEKRLCSCGTTLSWDAKESNLPKLYEELSPRLSPNFGENPDVYAGELGTDSSKNELFFP
jgi:hypothetical protein